MFEELGSRAMADLYAENSRTLGESAIRNRAFKAEGEKVTGFDMLPGLFFGLELDPLDKDASDEEKKEFALESKRVYEILSIEPTGKVLAKVVWPEKKEEDSKAGTTWVVRPEVIDWIYHPDETATGYKSEWRDQWDALQDSAYARWHLEDE